MFVLELTRQARAPANAAVGARHIRNERAWRRGAKPICLRHHVSDLVSTPTVSLYANRILLNDALVDHGLNSRQYTLQGALSRIADCVDDVRQKDKITVADVEGGIYGS